MISKKWPRDDISNSTKCTIDNTANECVVDDMVQNIFDASKIDDTVHDRSTRCTQSKKVFIILYYSESLSVAIL